MLWVFIVYFLLTHLPSQLARWTQGLIFNCPSSDSCLFYLTVFTGPHPWGETGMSGSSFHSGISSFRGRVWTPNEYSESRRQDKNRDNIQICIERTTSRTASSWSVWCSSSIHRCNDGLHELESACGVLHWKSIRDAFSVLFWKWR